MNQFSSEKSSRNVLFSSLSTIISDSTKLFSKTNALDTSGGFSSFWTNLGLLLDTVIKGGILVSEADLIIFALDGELFISLIYIQYIKYNIMKFLFLAAAFFFSSVSSIRNILEFGAIKNVDTVVAQFQNAQAIKKGILAVNQSTSERVIKIPKGTFYSMPIVFSDIHNISIVIEGKLSASKNVKQWPKKPDSAITNEDFVYMVRCTGIQISGGGKVDGRGYHWWIIDWFQIKSLLPVDKRPHLFNIQECENVSIHDLTMKNSPSFHLRIPGGKNFQIYNLDIKVNTTAQFNLLKKFSFVGILPTFPLNTDGIDPSGRNFKIYNLTVQNFDDVVVPKPSHNGSFCNCTEDILVQNITIRLGVGLSIGSVPPNQGHNCVRNVLFRNANFQYPLKGIYLKTNPGEKGSGQIVNITYKNMTMKSPIWWAIYLGPQQQKQPGGGGPGCMLYPFDPKGTCSTQPRIDVRNISLEDIKITDSLLFPILMRCNETNPCSGVYFKNVVINKWLIGNKHKGFVCENVKGIQEGGYPRIDCLNQTTASQQAINLREEEETLNQEKILEAMERAVNEVGYEEEDDEMDSIEEVLKMISEQ